MTAEPAGGFLAAVPLQVQLLAITEVLISKAAQHPTDADQRALAAAFLALRAAYEQERQHRRRLAIALLERASEREALLEGPQEFIIAFLAERTEVQERLRNQFRRTEVP